MIKIEVNNRLIDAVENETILTALKREGITVPTLCHMEGLPPSGACRICVVELENTGRLVTSCSFPVQEGMRIKTHSAKAIDARRTIVELLLANHPDDCFYCDKNGCCELQKLAENLGVRARRYSGSRVDYHVDLSSPAIVRTQAKCILCGKCVRICEEVQGVSAIDFVKRGSGTVIATAFNESLNVSSCVSCGQCTTVCPTGALVEHNQIDEVVSALNDPEKIVVIQHAPAVSVTLAEEFSMKPGTDVQGIMTTALRKIGFDRVFDTSFSADLTIMEEANELIERIKSGVPFLSLLVAALPGLNLQKLIIPSFCRISPPVKVLNRCWGQSLKAIGVNKKKLIRQKYLVCQ